MSKRKGCYHDRADDVDTVPRGSVREREAKKDQAEAWSLNDIVKRSDDQKV